MNKKISFLINPSAGFGETGKNLKHIKKLIKNISPSAEILLTRHAFHATSLTKQALRNGQERIIVIGGDGTLNEVVNGFFDKTGKIINKTASIAAVPSGSGCDFLRTIGQDLELEKAITKAVYEDAKPTDIGLVEAHDANGEKQKRFFINVSSLGLSGLVSGYMKQVTKKLGPSAAYFISTVQAIKAFKAPTILMVGDDGQEKTIENCSIISLANGKYYGGGMKIAPHALVDDGLLDCITISDLGVMFFLLNGQKVYKGTHLELENVSASRTSSCFIKSLNNEDVYIETDGELFAQLPAKYSTIHNAILVVR